jgi:hypothetical protein
MCLAELDPFKYQQQLAQCAQFLVDNQARNGQWGYGKQCAIPPIGKFPSTDKGPIPEIDTSNAQYKDEKGKLREVGQIEIKKGQSVGEDTGDNSNSQYAALGIRACLTGLVVVPKETVTAAEQWWEKNQKQAGGWGYGQGPNGDSGLPNEPAWGSMSAGGLGSLVIFKYYRQRIWGDKDADWKKAASVTRAASWIGSNLDFTGNAANPKENGGPRAWHYYWIYAVERAGRLLEIEQFTGKEWYPAGADYLLPKQATDGSWPQEDWSPNPLKQDLLPSAITETCFSVLFLRRATPTAKDTIPVIKSGEKPINAGEKPKNSEPPKEPEK